MRTRSLLAFAVLAAVALTVAGAAFSRTDTTPTLKGVVGPGYSIKLTKGGKKFESLKAGTYKFVINDKASIHSFSMDGPNGFDKTFTQVPFVGTKTMTVKLKAGKYKYYCSAHESSMFGFFTVT